MSSPVVIHWLRRDLRLEDNAALFHALKSGLPVLPVFIFDKNILEALKDHPDEACFDRRVIFIHRQLTQLKSQLRNMGSDLTVFYGDPIAIWKDLVQTKHLSAVYTNHDDEPYALKRDAKVSAILAENAIAFHTFKDHCIFERSEVVKDDGKPYTVFTPYSRKWTSKLTAFYLQSYPTEQYFGNLIKSDVSSKIPTLAEMGFLDANISFPETSVADTLLAHYAEQRNTPGIRGTSRLGIHLRFGTISIRQLARHAYEKNYTTFLNELIWRDFYMMILYHFPRVTDQAFKPEYDRIPWRNNEDEFRSWCTGNTGYPIVDAGMRELNQTGFMHNRVRMIVASFLTKHLLIDWRWGEAYFAKHLLDFELSSNNGGWQWAAGSGCDAAPYFRVFNPELQTQKFDPKRQYIRQWVDNFDSFDYPQPIVEHSFARKRALEVYGSILGKAKDTDV